MNMNMELLRAIKEIDIKSEKEILIIKKQTKKKILNVIVLLSKF